MLDFVDRVNDRLGALSAWLFFAIGGMIGYEVVSRYVFNAPTIWAEEMSRFFQLWATYLAVATLLRRRELIRITLLIERLGPAGRRAAEVFSLLVIAAFCAVAIWYGTDILLESIRLDRSTSTMLDVPQWTTEIVIPLGFALLLVQCAVEIVRLLAGAREPGEPGPGPGGSDP
jgi:TRAP-type C4-dicarboxylate transport system permease small subunit